MTFRPNQNSNIATAVQSSLTPGLGPCGSIERYKGNFILSTGDYKKTKACQIFQKLSELVLIRG